MIDSWDWHVIGQASVSAGPLCFSFTFVQQEEVDPSIFIQSLFFWYIDPLTETRHKICDSDFRDKELVTSLVSQPFNRIFPLSFKKDILRFHLRFLRLKIAFSNQWSGCKNTNMNGSFVNQTATASLWIGSLILYQYTQGNRWSEGCGQSSPRTDPSCWGTGWWTSPWTTCCCRWSQTASCSRASGSGWDAHKWTEMKRLLKRTTRAHKGNEFAQDAKLPPHWRIILGTGSTGKWLRSYWFEIEREEAAQVTISSSSARTRS